MVDDTSHNIDLHTLALQMKALADRIIATTEAKTQSSAKQPRWVTVADFAKRTGYSRRTISNYIKMGMPTVGRGRGRRVILAAALAWIERGGPTAAATVKGKRAAQGGELCR